MQHDQSKNRPQHKCAEKHCLLGSMVLLICMAGCATSPNSGTAPTPPTQGPQNYFAPYIVGTSNGGSILNGPENYAIDDSAKTFSQSTFQLLPLAQQGSQAINVGVSAAAERGLLSLGISTNYTNPGGAYVPTTFNPPKPGSFAVELAGQAGGLVQLVGQPVAPLVAAVQCPTLKTVQTYQFITIPAGLINASSSGQPGSWNPKTDTAYGSVDISSDGSNVTFDNIHQYTLPSVGGSGTPTQVASTSVAGSCGSTALGTTISAPGQVVAQNPGVTTNVPPQATIGIGSTGLLVEDNGVVYKSSGNNPYYGMYEILLGAGTGAVGLPKAANAIDIKALSGAQYLGFTYGAGTYSSAGASSWSSHLSSFGFSNTPSSCVALAANTSTILYGGDYTNDDPSTSPDGFGNCDLAIDLGTQDSANNGLFPKATVWLGGNYSANTTKATYSFPAVAIAGQLNGKYAIFLLGVDDTATPQPWAIYLLQSN
jgi:hypothetical protein